MGWVRFETGERRHYRGQAPGFALADEGDPRVKRSGGTGSGSLPLGMIVAYGRGTPSLARALSSVGIDVISHGTYAAAREELEHLRPQLILVGDGAETWESEADFFAFLRRTRKLDHDPVVLVLGDGQDPAAVRRALDDGADDLVCPPHSVSAIMLRQMVVRQLRDRHSHSPGLDRRVALGSLTLDLNTRQVSDGGRPFSLSGREFELLVRLMEAEGDVVPREALIHDIWGEEQGSAAVLDATVHRLRKKLDQKLDEPDMVTTVRGIGYRLEPCLTSSMSEDGSPPPGSSRRGVDRSGNGSERRAHTR